MLYREAGQFKTTYGADQSVFPIRQDRIGIALILFAAFVLVPLLASSFVLSAVFIPVLVFALAAIGLNLLTGYAGQVSLGTGAFMGVGAYTCYKLTTYFPQVNIIVLILASGLGSAAVGTVFGLPSLRIKGFYLAVATLAAQFFLSWSFVRIPWLYNYNVSGAIEVPTRTMLGVAVTGPNATPLTRYLVVLSIVTLMTWVASNLLRGLVLLLRGRGRHHGVPVVRRGRSGLVQYRSVVSHSVHGDRRRPGQPDRLVFRGDLHLGTADRAEGGAGILRPHDPCRDRRASAVHDRGRADHFLPDRRAGGPRAPVADRQAEAQGLAFPLLRVQTCVEACPHSRESGTQGQGVEFPESPLDHRPPSRAGEDTRR